MDGTGQGAATGAASGQDGAAAEVPGDLWQLYTYLGDKCDSYSRSSFEDFGLLFSTGAMAAWVPVSAQFPANALGAWAPLSGFVALLFFIVIVGTRTLAKQALVQYYLMRIAQVETSIAARLPASDGAAFAFGRHWPQWQRQHYEPIMLRFMALFALFLSFVPTAALWVGSGPREALVYLACFIVAGSVYASAAAKLRGAGGPPGVAP